MDVPNCRGKLLADPDFLYAAPFMTACAAFGKESRVKCANANKLHGKSGEQILRTFHAQRASMGVSTESLSQTDQRRR
jgi:hypothetical protein